MLITMDKKTCASCGEIIDAGLFIESGGAYYHEACWENISKEAIDNLAKPKIDRLEQEITGHWGVFKKFVVLTAVFIIIFGIEIAVYQADNLFLVVLAFGTFCLVLSCPIMIIFLLATIRKKQKEIRYLKSGSAFK